MRGNYVSRVERWLLEAMPVDPGRRGRDIRVTDRVGLFEPFWVSSEREADEKIDRLHTLGCDRGKVGA